MTAAAEVRLRPTTEADLDWVTELEGRPENARFVIAWPRARHRAAIGDRSMAHWIVGDATERPVGYVILSQVREHAPSVELVRLVIADKGRGYGRATLERVDEFAFDRLHAHRLWLDVFEDNHRARRIYRAAGYVEEGVLREVMLREGRWASLVVLSKLDRERGETAPRPEGAASPPEGVVSRNVTTTRCGASE